MDKDKVMKVDEYYVIRGTIYKVLKTDEEKGLVLLEKREPNEEMDNKVRVVIEHTGWDILSVGDHKAKLKKDNLPKRVEKTRGEEE